MLEWIKANKEWIFSGIGVVIVTGLIAFLKCYTVVRRKEYNELKMCKEKLHVYIDNNNIFKDLVYDTVDEVYVKTNINGNKEYYCPICLKTDKNRIHLSKKDGTIGNLFMCKKCNKYFGKGNYPNKSSNIDRSYIDWQ